jgi:hypothetical protein
METTSLELSFTTATGTIVRFQVSQPVMPVNSADINRVMDKMIATNIFETKGGPITAKKSARLVQRATSDIA